MNSTIISLFITVVALPSAIHGQTALDETSPWPRVRSTNKSTVTIYQPQVETWTKNPFTGRAAVDLKMAGEKNGWLGVVWFAASGCVDQSTRVVALITSTSRA